MPAEQPVNRKDEHVEIDCLPLEVIVASTRKNAILMADALSAMAFSRRKMAGDFAGH